MINWNKGMKKIQNGILNIWNAMLHSFHVLNDWMVWKPGDGLKIRVGEDPLVDSDSFYKLSEGLVNVLNEKGIFFLAQVSRETNIDIQFQNWKSSSQLGISKDYQEEWKSYITWLNSCGYKLLEMEDQLYWSWNTINGEINANYSFDSMLSNLGTGLECWWYRYLWKWLIPLKIKLLCWLMMENKILTWDNFIRKEGNGPNICSLCFMDAESVEHFMDDCKFTQSVWGEVKHNL